MHILKINEMKRIILAITVVLLAACQQDKIGFVDNVELMDSYTEKVDIETRFNSKVEALSKKRDSISQAFQLEAQAFQAKAQSMPQKKAQEEYGLMQQKGQFIGQQLQQEEQILQKSGQTEMDSLVNKVRKEIKAYGKANDYTYILGGGEGGSVLYGKEAHDLTDEILTLLNERYKK